MTRPWPWPADTALKRRERATHSYRAALEKAAPEVCAEIDAQMLDYGQRWVVPQLVTYQADDLLPAELVADYSGYTVKTVYEWRNRGLASVTTPDGIRFRFRDVQRWCGGDRTV